MPADIFVENAQRATLVGSGQPELPPVPKSPPPPPLPPRVTITRTGTGTFSVTTQGAAIEASEDLTCWNTVLHTNLHGSKLVGYDFRPDGKGFFR
jgi:hypothetical protein